MTDYDEMYKKICKGFIVAEIGKNHNGDLEIAKEMIKVAAGCGVDAVKFQSLRAEKLVIEDMGKIAHLEDTLGDQESVFDMIKSVELDREDHFALAEVAKNEGVEFFSTPEDLDVIDLLEEVGVNFYKIASLDLTFFQLIEKAANTGKPLIVSTGMATIAEIYEVINAINRCKNDKIVLLHCVSSYPPPIEDHNLNVIPYLESVFNLPIGYSDHSLGLSIPVAATALGAVAIEKHFTLDKSMPGPDHRISVDPEELEHMVKAVKEIRVAIGQSNKKPVSSELSMRENIRRKMVSSRTLSEGEVISNDMIEFKSSSIGMEPKYLDVILGRVLKKEMRKDEVFSWDHICPR